MTEKNPTWTNEEIEEVVSDVRKILTEGGMIFLSFKNDDYRLITRETNGSENVTSCVALFNYILPPDSNNDAIKQIREVTVRYLSDPTNFT